MELARNIVQAFPKIFKGLEEQERKVSHEQQNQDTDYDFCEDNDEMLMDEENPYVLLDFSSPQNVKKSDEGSSNVLFESQSSESYMTGSTMEVLFSEVPKHKTLHTVIPSAILPKNKENIFSVYNTEQSNAIVERPTTLHQAYPLPDPPPIEASLEDPIIRSIERVEERALNTSITNVVLNALEVINTIPTVGPSLLNQEGILNDRVISNASTPLATIGPLSVLGSSEIRTAPSQAGYSNVAVQKSAGNIPGHSINNDELNSNVVARSSALNSNGAVSAPLVFSQALRPSVLSQERNLNDRVISGADAPITARGPVSVPGSSEVRTASSQTGGSNVAVQQNVGNIPQPSNTELNRNVVARSSALNSSNAVSTPLVFSQATPQNHPQLRPSVVNQERNLNDRVISGAETPIAPIAARGPVSIPGSSEVQTASSQAGGSNVAVQPSAGNIPQPNNTELNSNVVARPSPLNLNSAVSTPLVFSQEVVQIYRQVVSSIVPPVVSVDGDQKPRKSGEYLSRI